MIIGILSGEAGVGKSLQAMQFEEDLLILDLENRLEEKRKRFFPDRLIEIRELMKYDNEYNEDQVASFNAFVSEIKTILKSEPPKTLVIDGIGELREYAHSKWAKDKNRRRAVTPGDWEEINDMVRESLFPLINWGRLKDVNVIFTSTNKDDYTITERDGKKESSKCGRVPAYKDWIGYNVDLLAELWTPCDRNKHPDGRYFVTVTKSPVGIFEEEITEKSLFEVLQKRYENRRKYDNI